MIRATYYASDNAAAVRDKQLAAMSDLPDDIYRTNMQISEINALNACLAVIRSSNCADFTSKRFPTTISS
jgi:hypothetical protein